jgi:hypothetical protein
VAARVQGALEAVGKRPSAVRRAVRQAHGPEQSRRAALPSSLVTAAYFYVRLSQIPLFGGDSSGFRKPCTWTFSISLSSSRFSDSLLSFLKKYS